MSVSEARAHGAGYFAFSQDAEERARQRAELDELRDNTETQQSRAELARKRKNKQLKERLRKVRERKRLKLGLPIEGMLKHIYVFLSPTSDLSSVSDRR